MKSLLLAMLGGLMMVGAWQPASASGGWLWFDKYPWVYSSQEKGWIYLVANGDKLYAYRPSTKAWSEFNVSESSTDTTSGQTSTDSSTSNATTSFDPSNPPKTWTTSSTSNIEMIWVEPGTFMTYLLMVPNVIPGGGLDLPEPNIKVTLTKGFYLGKYEVTQAQYEAVMTGNTSGASATPSHFGGNPNRPVEMVSWDDAQVFLTRLNAAEQAAGRLPAGWAYVLPTAAQWEYSCRAGTTTAYSWGDSIDSSKANYNWDGEANDGNDFKQTRDVGQYTANPWGFFDMHGNVREWTADWWPSFYSNSNSQSAVVDPTGPSSGSGRVLLNGSWSDTGEYMQSAWTHFLGATSGGSSRGFRVSLQQQ